jgi:transcriptional regulator with XRE-family HTH domain
MLEAMAEENEPGTRKAFRAALAEAIARSGRSHRRICRETGLSRSTLRAWLAGAQTPSLTKVLRLAGLFAESEMARLETTLPRVVRIAPSHNQHPFVKLLDQARARKGLSLQETFRRSSLYSDCIRNWTRESGAVVPYNDSLERLAKVLDAPELLSQDLLRYKWRRYSLTCSSCGYTSRVRPGQYAGHVKRFSQPRLDYLEETGTGTWICAGCLAHAARRQSGNSHKE